MPKKKEVKLSEEEQDIAQEVMEEVKEEIREETPQKIRKVGRIYGILSIIVGIIGIFGPFPFTIIIGFVALLLGRDAIGKGEKTLGRIGAILGFFAVIGFVLGAGMNAGNLGT